MRSSSRSCPATRKSGPGWRASTAATPTTCAISMRSSIVPTSTRSTSPSRTTGTSTSVGGKEKVRKFKAADQFAPELIAFSKAILEGTDVEPDGEEGLRRSEEHTSELQSRLHLVCRLLLEKKKKNNSRKDIRTKKKRKQKSAKQMIA